MRRLLVPAIAGAALLVTGVIPAAAVVGGQPDGEGHPYSGLVLVPGVGFCSGTLIDEDVVLTAGHCTDFFDEENVGTVYVTFDTEAAVDLETWEIIEGEGNWYTSTDWVTHPEYVEEEWPFTYDYGLVFLDEPVTGIEPADLPEPEVVDELIGTTGQTAVRFNDVGYGVNGKAHIGNGFDPTVDFVRRVSTQRYNPSRGAVGTLDPLWLILGQAPSPTKGSGCPGDSGSGIFVAETDTIVAVHTGGYGVGFEGNLCGRITSLNHRIDVPEVLDWIRSYID
ncbi:trypsin-like serine protease [Geodermatophilus sp. SYSU D00691]